MLSCLTCCHWPSIPPTLIEAALVAAAVTHTWSFLYIGGDSDSVSVTVFLVFHKRLKAYAKDQLQPTSTQSNIKLYIVIPNRTSL